MSDTAVGFMVAAELSALFWAAALMVALWIFLTTHGLFIFPWLSRLR